MSLAPSQQGYRPNLSASSLITPSLLSLTDEPLNQNQIDASVQDYFLIELMHTLRHSSRVARDKLKQREEDMLVNGLLTSTLAAAGSTGASGQGPEGFGSTSKMSLGSSTAAGGASAKPSANDEDEAVRIRLDALGAHVGANLAERCVGLYFIHHPG